MSLNEAAELIVRTSMMESGMTFLLDVGPPIKIEKLAERMIAYAGLKIKSRETLMEI